MRERRPHLLAGDHPLVAVEDGAGLDVREVAAGVRLGEALAPQLVDRLDLREEAPLLLVGAELDQRRGEEALAEERDPRRRVRARVLLVEDDLLGERRRPAAVLLRPRQPDPAVGAEQLLPLDPRRPSPSRRPGRRPARARRTRPVRCSASQARTSARKAASAGVSTKSMAGRRYLTDRSGFQCGRARSHWADDVTPRIGSLACSASSPALTAPVLLRITAVAIGSTELDPALTEAVLEKLGFSSPPDPDRAGLDAVYAAWCRRVPFDNLVKRIHLVSGSAEPFPNGPAEAFFASWLRHGTGGTCWPSAGGAPRAPRRPRVRRPAGIGGDVRPPHRPGPHPRHDDRADRRRRPLGRLVDAHATARSRSSRARRPASTTRFTACASNRSTPCGACWWTHPFLDEMLGCLLLDDDVTAEHYLARYEASRDLSPFNTGVYATRSTDRPPRDGRVRPPLRAASRRRHVRARRRRPRPGAHRGVRLLGRDRGAAPARRTPTKSRSSLT